MRLYLFLAVLTGFTFISCKKDNSINPVSQDLAGTWKMTSVKDISNNTLVTKPVSVNGDVEISFSFSTPVTGFIYGMTPSNYLNAAYTIDSGRRLSVPAVSMTKVMEKTWGLYFIDNITSSQDYFFDMKGSLNINTTTGKILGFARQ